MKKKEILILLFSVIIASLIGLIIINNIFNKDNENYIFVRNATISEIDTSNKKINVYVFWGDGCPHCEELLEYLKDSQKKYGKYYNVYGFEIWKNKENATLKDKFAEEIGDTDKIGSMSVPYYIIGDKSKSGYGSNMNEDIVNLILEKYEEKDSINTFESIIKQHN